MQYSDLATPDFLKNPYPVFDAMRAEGQLVKLAPKLYATSHYGFGEKLLLDRRFGKGIVEAVKARYGEGVIDQPPFRTFRSMLPGLNPPKHTNLRALLMKSFNARQVEKFREASYTISNQLIDRLVKEPQGDLVTGFAFLLPMQTMCTILGVPLSDGAMFKRAADRAAGALNVTPLNAEQLEESRKSAIELETYFAKVLAERRKEPGDDLISQMILAEEDGQRLTDDEIVANLCFLFVAGHETTENMIGNTLIALQRHPEQRERVKADLSIMPRVVTEALRYDSSVQIAQRVALEEVELEGQTIQRGDLICVVPRRRQSRSGEVREPGPARHRPRERAPALVRRRPALLPGRAARAAGDRGRAGGGLHAPAEPAPDQSRRAALSPQQRAARRRFAARHLVGHAARRVSEAP